MFFKNLEYVSELLDIGFNDTISTFSLSYWLLNLFVSMEGAKNSGKIFQVVFCYKLLYVYLVISLKSKYYIHKINRYNQLNTFSLCVEGNTVTL